VGSANIAIIKKIKETLTIPVFANGGVSKFADVEHALKEAGVDGVMSSEYILEDPALFANKMYDLDDLALEYFEMCDKYPGEHQFSHIKSHLFKILYKGLTIHTDLRSQLGQAKSIE
jgi:tRNA-dihydrouridine synthase 1